MDQKLATKSVHLKMGKLGSFSKFTLFFLTKYGKMFRKEKKPSILTTLDGRPSKSGRCYKKIIKTKR